MSRSGFFVLLPLAGADNSDHRRFFEADTVLRQQSGTAADLSWQFVSTCGRASLDAGQEGSRKSCRFY